ncbi:hypothetical protein BZA77DRAFT_334687 [Pyronema omphalodes]|nr:hypothetical protein BZA77DRAFT_334687 [Pyronema omphalodes]
MNGENAGRQYRDNQQQQQQQRRRRSGQGVDAVKHRRTRSGCFTCRTRRVKCDEKHPICERCKKGNRECTYPEVTPNSKSKKPRGESREGSSSLEDVEEDDEEYLDDVSPPALRSSTSQSRLRSGATRRDSWHDSEHGRHKNRKTAGSSADQTPSPRDPESSAPTSPTGSLRRTASAYSLNNAPEWAHIPHDIAFYLNYHKKMLTCHHYLLKSDCDDFFKTTILEHALQNDALMYAVAAFSSFHYNIFYATNAYHTFLEYYNEAIILLREALDKPHTIDTILTILQLACFEEYLGDWASLQEHRNAASSIIKTLYTPETMAESFELRMVFNWFIHFDLLCAMMAAHRATTSPEWCLAASAAVMKQHLANPSDLRLKIEKAAGDFRDITLQVSMMTARRLEGGTTLEEFERDFMQCLQTVTGWFEGLDKEILEGAERIQWPAKDREEGGRQEDCPFQLAPLYTGIRWAVNFLLMDYYGLIIVLKTQIAITSAESGAMAASAAANDPSSTTAVSTPATTSSGASSSGISVAAATQEGLASAGLADLAVKICRLLAAIEAYPHTPAGALLSAQAPIGLAAMWIPDAPGYRSWLQKQLAKAERMGFVYPLAFRTKIATMWGDPKLKYTWIDNNSETAIALTIRQLVDSRDAEMPRGAAGRDVKAIRSLLETMRLDSKGSGVGVRNVEEILAGSLEYDDYDQESSDEEELCMDGNMMGVHGLRGNAAFAQMGEGNGMGGMGGMGMGGMGGSAGMGGMGGMGAPETR